MILRRFAEHLRNQHWTAICIELLIVIAGVFIGTQVSNWNEDRVINRKADAFAQSLRSDLREEAWSSELLLQYNKEVLANAERAVAALEGKTEMSNEALLTAAYRATQYRQKGRRRSTYDELTSTGAIGLIRDPILRDTAMRVYTNPMWDNIAREGIQSEYRRAFRMSLPNDVQQAIADGCGDRPITVGDYAAITNSLDYPCTIDLPPEQIAAAAQTLRSNPTLLPLLRLRLADIRTRLFDFTVNNKDMLEALREIAESASQSPPAQGP
jgi:hypothetical protein